MRAIRLRGMADLSDTAVVLPDTPQAWKRLKCTLTLMGHFGAQTGYPVLNVTVTNCGRDEIEFGRQGLPCAGHGRRRSRRAITKVNGSLQVKLRGAVEPTAACTSRTRKVSLRGRQHAWWKVRSSDHMWRAASWRRRADFPMRMIEGIESPLQQRQPQRGAGGACATSRIVPNFLDDLPASRSQSSDRFRSR